MRLTLMCVYSRARAAVASLVGLSVAAPMLLLAGCSLATNTAETNLVVDFSSRQADAARHTVSAACGKLPGISVVPPRKDDVSVYFDVSKANSAQQNALANCVNNLVTTDKSLGIRGYRFDDGTGN